jgi:hypothetical protein
MSDSAAPDHRIVFEATRNQACVKTEAAKSHTTASSTLQISDSPLLFQVPLRWVCGGSVAGARGEADVKDETVTKGIMSGLHQSFMG